MGQRPRPLCPPSEATATASFVVNSLARGVSRRSMWASSAVPAPHSDNPAAGRRAAVGPGSQQECLLSHSVLSTQRTGSPASPCPPPTQQACNLQSEGQAAGGVQVQPGERAPCQRLVDQQRAEGHAAAGIVL